MSWFEAFLIWANSQQPFWAAIYLFLCLSLAVSLGVLGRNSKLGIFRENNTRGLFITYLVFKGLSYIPFCVPVEVFVHEEAARRLFQLFLMVSLGALAGCMWHVWSKWKTPAKQISMTLVGLLLTLVGVVSAMVRIDDLRLYTASIELLMSVSISFFFLRYVKKNNSLPIKQAKVLAYAWVAFVIFDYLAWSFAGVEFSYQAAYRMVGWVDGAIALIVVIIGCNELFASRDEEGGGSKTKYGHKMVLVEWVCLVLMIILAYAGSTVLINKFYREFVDDANRDAESLRDRILAWESRGSALVGLVTASPTVHMILEGTATTQAMKVLNEELDACAANAVDAVCYILDKNGNVVSASNRNTPESFVGKNLAFRSYFESAIAGKSGIEIARGAFTTIPGVFSSHPVISRKDGSVIGVGVLKKVLKPNDLFNGYNYAFVSDEKGETILTSHDLLKQLDLKKYWRESIQDQKLWPGVKSMVRIGSDIYVYGSAELNNIKGWVSVFHPTEAFFVYRSTVYIVVVCVLIFTSSAFVFSRYIVARTEKEIDQAQEFRDILDSSPNCITQLNREMKFISVNGSEVPFLGMSADELMEKSFIEVWPKENTSMITEKIEQAFRGDRVTYESSYIHPDGHTKYFFVVCGPLYNSSNGIKSVVVIWIDITHRKKVETELVRRLAQERVTGAIVAEFISQDSVEEAVKNSIEHLFNFVEVDRVGWFQLAKDSSGIASCLYKFERDNINIESLQLFFPKIIKKLLPVGTPERLWAGEVVEINDKAGTIDEQKYLQDLGLKSMLMIPVFVSGQLYAIVRIDSCDNRRSWPEAELGYIKNIIKVVQDSIERYQSQERLQILNAAVQSAEDGVMIATPLAGDVWPRITFVNKAFCKQTGYSEEELIGMSPVMLASDTNSDAITKMAECFRGSTNFRLEMLNKRKNGTEYLAEVNISPVFNATGITTHFVTIEHDITEQKEMQTRASLSSKLESIGQLAAGIAHEINTPAQFISDNLYFIKENWSRISEDLEMIQQTAADDKKKKLSYVVAEMPSAISDALEGVTRISTIVQAMREFSHNDGDRVPSDINKAIETTITVARNEWKYCAEVKTLLDKNIPRVLCYISDINQVVLNLIVNAAQAIRERYTQGEVAGVITVRTYVEGSMVKIEVEDNGNGIPENIKSRIFDPFFTTKAIGKGTGQGLYLAHRVITDKHKGILSFVSEVGVGTKFTIALPV